MTRPAGTQQKAYSARCIAVMRIRADVLEFLLRAGLSRSDLVALIGVAVRTVTNDLDPRRPFPEKRLRLYAAVVAAFGTKPRYVVKPGQRRGLRVDDDRLALVYSDGSPRVELEQQYSRGETVDLPERVPLLGLAQERAAASAIVKGTHPQIRSANGVSDVVERFRLQRLPQAVVATMRSSKIVLTKSRSLRTVIAQDANAIADIDDQHVREALATYVGKVRKTMRARCTSKKVHALENVDATTFGDLVEPGNVLPGLRSKFEHHQRVAKERLDEVLEAERIARDTMSHFRPEAQHWNAELSAGERFVLDCIYLKPMGAPFARASGRLNALKGVA
jgi:hypothetical protein